MEAEAKSRAGAGHIQLLSLDFILSRLGSQ